MTPDQEVCEHNKRIDKHGLCEGCDGVFPEPPTISFDKSFVGELYSEIDNLSAENKGLKEEIKHLERELPIKLSKGVLTFVCKCGEALTISPIQMYEDNIKQLESLCNELAEALKFLYEEIADYIRINHLGDVHHNRSMQRSSEALQKYHAMREGNAVFKEGDVPK